MNEFTGLFPALITPFNEDCRISAESIEKLIDANIKKGVSGFYICGSSGESFLLSMKERKYMIDVVSEAVKGRSTFIANIGLFATKHGQKLARYAEKKGAAAISSVPPFYFPFQIDEYVQYYADLAASVSVPMLVYNVPALSGVNFTMNDLDRLLSIPNVMGMKHTSFNLFQLQLLIARYPDKNFFMGHDELFLSALSVGVKAGIGTTFNFMAEKYLQMMKAFDRGDMEECLRLQNEANEIIDVLCKVGVFKGTKAILQLQGFDAGTCRKPFLPLNDEDMKLVKQTAEKYRLI
jgi:N-acetylneuraminate lyase